jgi:hypothetical protein
MHGAYPPQGQYVQPARKNNAALIALLCVAGFCSVCLLGSFISGNSEDPSADNPPAPSELTPAEREYQRKRAEEAEETRQREAVEAAQQAEDARQLAAAEAVRGKRPEPSAWDGITPEANEWLKQNLRDYESMELMECSVIVEYGDDAWAQRVKYRARNGFGGMNIEQQLFVIKNGQVLQVIPL